MKISYPYAKTVDVADNYFGTWVNDPYRWLENAEDSEVLDFVEQENQYTSSWFQEAESETGLHLSDFISHQRMDSDTFFYQSLIHREHCYYAVMEHEGNHAFVRMDTNFQNPEILLDREKLGGDMNIFEAAVCPSDSSIFAIYVLKDHAPRPSILIYNIQTKKIDACLDYCFSYCWSEDGSTLIYADVILEKEKNRNINRVCAYTLSTGKTEVLYCYDQNSVYIEVAAGPEKGIFAQVLLTYGDGILVYINKEKEVIQLTQGVGTANYIGQIGEACYFLTDIDAPFGRLVRIPMCALQKEMAVQNSEDTVLVQRDALLASCGVDSGNLYAVYQQDASSVLYCFDKDGRTEQKIDLPDAYGNLTLPKCIKPENHRCYIEFESFLCPRSILQLNMETAEITVLYQEKEQGDVSGIEVRRQFITARDGCQIMAYLVYPRECTQTTPIPVMMYGYGGYASSSPPWNQNMVTGTRITEWVQKGRMYVHCIIRGGSEYGARWHEEGMLKNKKHAFEDFIDIAQWLIQTGWTTEKLITATGLSNGGLLMAAVATIRPELFGTVIASVPHTDMLRFCEDDRGPMYITEYGDPKDEDMFPYLYSYSPYHNISADTCYPAMYIQTGECDNNVPPYHGKKFAARLQQEASQENPVLLRVLPEGSHDRGSGEYYYKTTAEMQMFIEVNLFTYERSQNEQSN